MFNFVLIGPNDHTVQAAPLGNLREMMLGHDNSGHHPAWYCNTVSVSLLADGMHSETVDNKQRGRQTWFFPVHRWLIASTPGAGAGPQMVQHLCSPKIRSEQRSAATQIRSNKLSFAVTAKTGDRRGAGTDGDVAVVLYGSEGQALQWRGNYGGVCGTRALRFGGPDSMSTCEVLLEAGPADFRRGGCTSFYLGECAADEDVTTLALSRARVRHSSLGSNWYLDYLVVEAEASNSVSGPGQNNTRSDVMMPATVNGQQKWVFRCYRWLRTNEVVELLPLERSSPLPHNELAAAIQPETWIVTAATGELRGSGTTATIYIELVGTSSSSGMQEMLPDGDGELARGTITTFQVQTTPIGQLQEVARHKTAHF